MSNEQIAEVNRCLGILEGVSNIVTDVGVSDCLACVVERIENVFKEVQNEAD